MENPAPADHPVHDVIRRRWSGRAFADRPVPREVLLTLFEAARWAPSSYNEQPWSYVVATRDDREGFERLAACLSEGNRRWAPAAPVLFLSVVKTFLERTGRPNRVALHDVGIAAGNLLAQATALGLVAHPMAGFDLEKARESFALPEGYEPVAVFAVGYAAPPDSLPEDLREREVRPRVRKPLAEFVFAGRWGEPSPLVGHDDPPA